MFAPIRGCAPVVHGTISCGQKSFKLGWRCHQLQSGFLAKDHWPQMSRQSCLPTNNKDDIEMIPGAVHRFHSIYLIAGEHQKTSGDRLTKAVRPVTSSNGVPRLQMRTRNMKERMDGWVVINLRECACVYFCVYSRYGFTLSPKFSKRTLA